MAYPAPNRASFSAEDLTEIFLGAVSHMLVAVVPPHSGGRLLLPTMIRLRVALVKAPTDEHDGYVPDGNGSSSPQGPARFRIAVAGEPTDTISVIEWHFETPRSVRLSLEMSGAPVTAHPPDGERA